MKFARALVSLRRRLLALPLLLTVTLVTFALLPVTPRASAASSSWSDSLAEYGMPSSPQQWQPSNWDVQVHIRDMQHAGDAIDPQMADHGADCSAPPAQHRITTWQQAVFVCHSHVMTTIADGGYGEVALTPDRMADWSAGPVTIGFSVSTTHYNARDWWALDVTPFGEQLALPFDVGGVDLQGMPAHYIEVRTDNCGNNDKTLYRVVREAPGATGDARSFGDAQSQSLCLEDVTGIQPSASVRTPLELVISQTGYIFRVGAASAVAPGKVLTQGDWKRPLTFTRGVVQFIHHSYNPDKAGTPADTWHWSNFSISSAVQYTLLHPTDHRTLMEPGGAVSFAQPAPAASFLKFAAIGTAQVSYDGGKTYTPAQKPPLYAGLFHDEHFTSYLTPVPSGVSSVLLKLAGGWYGQGMARDFSLVSETLVSASVPAPASTAALTTAPSKAKPISPASAPLLVGGIVAAVALAVIGGGVWLRRRRTSRPATS
jgi:hypothetical protein